MSPYVKFLNGNLNRYIDSNREIGKNVTAQGWTITRPQPYSSNNDSEEEKKKSFKDVSFLNLIDQTLFSGSESKRREIPFSEKASFRGWFFLSLFLSLNRMNSGISHEDSLSLYLQTIIERG